MSNVKNIADLESLYWGGGQDAKYNALLAYASASTDAIDVLDKVQAILAGGTTGQVLAKTSGTDYATGWANARLAGSAGRALNTAGAFFDGSTGLVTNGIPFNYVQAADSAALSITGDIDIKVKMRLSSWTGNQYFLAKESSGTTYSYRMYLQSGVINFQWSTNGTSTIIVTSSAGVTHAADSSAWVRATIDVDNGSSQRVIKFYQSTNGTTWTQLGNTITQAGATSIFDSTGVLAFGAMLANPSALFTNGTMQRVIIQSAFDTNDNTSNVAFDADLETVPANALAFTESSANAATVSLVTTRYQYGVPNVQWSTSNATQALTANRVYYQPFLVTEPTTIDAVTFRVTAGPASAANVRCGIYASDSNYQPTGAPVLDSGNVAVGTSATGNFITTVTPVTLQPGLYLSAINTSVNMTMQVARGGLAGADITNGTSAIYLLMLGTQTQGAFPNPGTAWDTRTMSTTGANHMLFYRWSPA